MPFGDYESFRVERFPACDVPAGVPVELLLPELMPLVPVLP